MSSPTNISTSNNFPSALFKTGRLVTGILVTTPGLIILFGRKTGNSALLQIRSPFVPMRLNTVLGVFLCGPESGVSDLEVENSSALGNLAIFILFFLSALRYLFNINFRIDQLFINRKYFSPRTKVHEYVPLFCH